VESAVVPLPGAAGNTCTIETRLMTDAGAAEGPPRFNVQGGPLMGRGRQKAKQTKVARDLKYHNSGFDPNALTAELSGLPVVHHPAPVVEDVDEDDEYSDIYSKYIDVGDEDDEGPAAAYANGTSHR
jgi:hypothetical protein